MELKVASELSDQNTVGTLYEIISVDGHLGGLFLSLILSTKLPISVFSNCD